MISVSDSGNLDCSHTHSLLLPSTDPEVPNSANIKLVTCSSLLFMRLQISGILAKIVFLFPSLKHCALIKIRLYRSISLEADKPAVEE